MWCGMYRTPCPKLRADQVRMVSTIALVDPRTIRKAMAGERVAPMALTRISRALEQLGLLELLPPPPANTR